MTLPAASTDSTTTPLRYQADQPAEIDHYRAWLDQVFQSGVSDSVRSLIADISSELDAIPAVGWEPESEFAVAVRGAVESVAFAVRSEALPTR